MPAGTSLTLSKPRIGGRVSTGFSHHPGHGCYKRQAVYSARKIAISPEAPELLPVLPCPSQGVATLPLAALYFHLVPMGRL